MFLCLNLEHFNILMQGRQQYSMVISHVPAMYSCIEIFFSSIVVTSSFGKTWIQNNSKCSTMCISNLEHWDILMMCHGQWWTVISHADGLHFTELHLNDPPNARETHFVSWTQDQKQFQCGISLSFPF